MLIKFTHLYQSYIYVGNLIKRKLTNVSLYFINLYFCYRSLQVTVSFIDQKDSRRWDCMKWVSAGFRQWRLSAWKAKKKKKATTGCVLEPGHVLIRQQSPLCAQKNPLWCSNWGLGSCFKTDLINSHASSTMPHPEGNMCTSLNQTHQMVCNTEAPRESAGDWTNHWSVAVMRSTNQYPSKQLLCLLLITKRIKSK